MLYVVFISAQFAHELKVGRYGAFVLFPALGAGLIGFVAQGIIKFFSARAT